MVRCAVSPALQGPQQLVGQLRAVRETGLVQLGTQVVVVEHEPGAVEGAKDQGDRPEDVRRVAGLDAPRTARTVVALSVSQAVARNEYTYSATKPILLPPGA